MVEFVHHKIQVINGYLTSLNQVQNLLLERSFYFEMEANIFLKTLQQYFVSIGDTAKESEILRFVGLLQTVKKGFDPIKLEKITIGRKEFFWGISYHVVENILKIITDILEQEEQKLKDADEIVSNTLLGLVQNQIIQINDLKKIDSISKIELFWQQLVKQNASIALLEMKMKLKISNEDIYMLIDNNISKMTQ